MRRARPGRKLTESMPGWQGPKQRARPATRHVSIRGDIYERLKAHCERQGVSMSSFVSELAANLAAAVSDVATPSLPRVVVDDESTRS